MKTFKLLFAAIIFVGFANAVSAQSEAAVDATANILSSVSIEAAASNANLNFGDINFDPVTVEPGTDNAAQFLLTTNSNVQLNVALTEDMAHEGDNSITLPFNFETTGLQITDSDNLSQDFDPTNSFNLWDKFDSYTIGVFDISLGGTVTPAANQLAGNYLGEITITLDNSGM